MSEVLWVSDRSEFQDLLDTETIVVVDFTAPGWCVPCMRFAPVFENAAEKTAEQATTLGHIVWVAVDVDDADWASEEFGFKSVPTVFLFHSGEVLANLRERTVLGLINEIKSYL